MQILINSVDVTNLVSVKMGLKDIFSSESSTDLAGTTNKDIITQKRVLNFECGLLTQTQTATLLNSLDIKTLGGTNIDVTYPDIKLGTNTTKAFHLESLSDVTAVPYGDDLRFSGLAFTLEEIGGMLG